MRPRVLAAAALLLVTATPGWAEVFQVGPTRPYTNLGQVAPLLDPGDVVEVDGNATYPNVTFTRSGAPGNPIVVRGLRVNGNRPLISGGTNTVQFELSNHMVFEGFEVTGGSFRCIYHHANDITVRDSRVRDCPAHGILGADNDSGSLLLEFVEVRGCGNGTSQHAIYIATDEVAFPGSVFRMQHCWVHDQNGGNAVKTRAERNEIYYNWIEGTLYHLLELIGPDPSGGVPPEQAREDSDVVGNVLVHKAYGAIDGSFYFVRIGGDGTGETNGRYRFLNNTFIRTSVGTGSAAFRCFDGLESVEMHNNVFYTGPAGAPRILRDLDANWTSGSQQISGQNNWVESGATDIPTQWTGTVSGASPGFVDFANFDLRPAIGSPLVGLATMSPTSPPGYPFPGPLFPPAYQPPLRSVATVAWPRAADGDLDSGAYEAADLIFADGFD